MKDNAAGSDVLLGRGGSTGFCHQIQKHEKEFDLHNWLQTDVGNKDVNNCFLRPGLAPVVGPVDGVQPDHHLQF